VLSGNRLFLFFRNLDLAGPSNCSLPMNDPDAGPVAPPIIPAQQDDAGYEDVEQAGDDAGHSIQALTDCLTCPQLTEVNRTKEVLEKAIWKRIQAEKNDADRKPS